MTLRAHLFAIKCIKIEYVHYNSLTNELHKKIIKEVRDEGCEVRDERYKMVM